jgi:outer membrane protein OmpA-like peptidoglycan-associated protein
MPYGKRSDWSIPKNKVEALRNESPLLIIQNSIPDMLRSFFFALLPALLPFCVSAQSIFDSVRVARTAEVYFATGKYDLNAEANTVLDTMLAAFQKTKHADRVRIVAHTDSVGTSEKNLLLSKNRAQAVREALVHRGLTAEKLEVTGLGAREPAANNATEEGRQRNRRATVEILFTIPMTELKGRIKDKKTGAGIQATVVFSYKSLQDSVKTDTTGFYKVRLPANTVVKVDAYSPDYFFESTMRKVYGSGAMVKGAVESGDIVLAPAKAGETAVLKNLFFVGNEAVLLKTSEPELPKVLRFMQINPNLKIEIGGHVNPGNTMPAYLQAIQKTDQDKTGKDFEWTLSEQRAQTVYNFLIEHGIPASRMTYKGYGPSKARFPHAENEKQAEQNRRVEIRVTE